MIKWLLKQLEKAGRKSIIMDRDDQEEYLTRYYLAWPDGEERKKKGMPKNIPFNTFLHQFMRSDDPVFHNHPWEWYLTVILKGGYWEHTPWGTTWRGPGTYKFQQGNRFKYLNYKKGQGTFSKNFENVRALNKGSINPLLHSDLHWVEIPKPGETWTLFTRGRTFGEWGFVPDINTGHWIQHEQYLNSQRKSTQ